MKNIILITTLLISAFGFSQVQVTQQQLFSVGTGEATTPPTVDTESPSAPTSLVASNPTTNRVAITWTASTDNVGVTQYLLYNSSNALVQTFIGTDGDITGLSPETTYTGYYLRAIDAEGNLSLSSNTISFTTTAILSLTSNMIDEQAYYNAVLLPVAKLDSLQAYIDLYNHVRLEKGFYGFNTTPFEVTIGSNQSLFGHPEVTQVPNIIIEAGSTNVHLENLWPYQTKFNSGAPITNCVLKNIKNSTISSNGGMLENNLFLNINSQFNFDMSVSGYFKNNRIVRHQVHTNSPQLVLKGNSTTPSTGNVVLWSNYLTANGDGANLDNMGDINFIGIDAEGWNIRNQSTTGALFYANNMGNIKISDFIGGGDYSTNPKPAWIIGSNNLLLFNKTIWSQSSTVQNTALSGTNVFSVLNGGAYNVISGTDVRVHTTSEPSAYDVYSVYNNGLKQIATMTDATAINNIKDIILDTPYTPIERPVHETLPDPLGANWANERIGKPDSRAYIQGLIDANNIAELPEGIFYISGPLIINAAAGINQGIIGQGTGKTVICGLTDDFPLITAIDSTQIEAKINLAYLTLQGGSKGLYIDTNVRLMAFNNWKFVIFRNQNIGVHVDKIFGLDNNNFDHLSFVNCGTGFLNNYQSRPTSGTPEYNDWLTNNLGYVDKTVFYRSQFINCEVGAVITAQRACNLNMFLDCKFHNNRLPLNVTGNRNSMLVNSDFTNNTGGSYDYLIDAGDISAYSCNFINNTTANVFNGRKISAEGCNFLDVSNFARPTQHFDQDHYIFNCYSNGTYGGGWRYNYSAFINSYFANSPQYSKLLVNLNKTTLTTIIDEISNPYPQFYVKH